MDNTSRAVAGAIERVGCPAALIRGGSRISFTASIQPVFGGSAAKDISSPEGFGNRMEYTLYAAANSPELNTGDEISCLDSSYTVLRAELYSMGGEPLYRKAALCLNI